MAIPEKIKQLANDIRTKIYGKEVRESLARGIEEAGKIADETRVRQDNVEAQFQAVLDETTDKDVISAPEITAARVGADNTTHSNLKARLDTEHQQVMSQLAQKATKQELENKVAPKADKTYVEDNLSLKRNRFEKIEPEDLSERSLALVTGDGTINIETIPQNQSVSREKYDKAILSKNLFDKERVVKGHTISTNGNLKVGSSRNTSDFIPVTPVTNYTFNNVDVVAFYNHGKEYISQIKFGASERDKIKTIETPDSCYFIRFSYLNNSSISKMDKVMVNEGDVAIWYEPYYFKLPDLIVDEENLSGNVKEGFVAKEYTLNLFDKHAIKEFTGLDHLWGSEMESETRNTSDFIPVKENTEYSFIRGRYVCFYDQYKHYIDGIDTYPDSTNSFVTPGGTYYVRFDYYRDTIEDDQQMLVEGSTIPDEYVPYGFKIKNLIVDTENAHPRRTDLNPQIIKGFNSWEDFIIVGNEFWGFGRSDKSGLGYYENGIGSLYFYSPEGTLLKTLQHNFGHCNTVDYNEMTDTLILGSGSGYRGLDEWIYVIKGVKHWRDLPNDTLLDLEGSNIEGSQITKIFVGREFGDKVNVVWGEDNFGKYNICHAISNDGQDFRKILLGQGDNVLDSGDFIEGRSATEFNGTYKILGHWQTDNIEVIQGGCFYNGYIYLGLGHHGLWLAKYKLNWDMSVDVEQKHERYYHDNGDVYGVDDGAPTAGVVIKDGMIYLRVRGARSAINKFQVF